MPEHNSFASGKDVRDFMQTIFEYAGVTATFKSASHTTTNSRGEPIKSFTNSDITVVPYNSTFKSFETQEFGELNISTPTFAVKDSVEPTEGDELEYRGDTYLIEDIKSPEWAGETALRLLDCSYKED